MIGKTHKQMEDIAVVCVYRPIDIDFGKRTDFSIFILFSLWPEANTENCINHKRSSTSFATIYAESKLFFCIKDKQLKRNVGYLAKDKKAEKPTTSTISKLSKREDFIFYLFFHRKTKTLRKRQKSSKMRILK